MTKENVTQNDARMDHDNERDQHSVGPESAFQTPEARNETEKSNDVDVTRCHSTTEMEGCAGAAHSLNDVEDMSASLSTPDNDDHDARQERFPLQPDAPTGNESLASSPSWSPLRSQPSKDVSRDPLDIGARHASVLFETDAEGFGASSGPAVSKESFLNGIVDDGSSISKMSNEALSAEFNSRLMTLSMSLGVGDIDPFLGNSDDGISIRSLEAALQVEDRVEDADVDDLLSAWRRENAVVLDSVSSCNEPVRETQSTKFVNRSLTHHNDVLSPIELISICGFCILPAI